MTESKNPTNKLKVAVIGVGHLGQHHARIYSEMESTELFGVVDADEDRGREIAERHGVPHFRDSTDVVEHVEAVSVVTPTKNHLDAARPFVEAGRSVLVEKPLTSTLEEADELIGLAESKGVVLQVGHVERFNPVVAAALPHIDRPLFIECDRIHPFSLRSTEVSVVLDLMIHDIDLVLHITDDEPVDIDALGTSVLSPTEDLATARILFQGGCTAMVKTSRVALNRSRKIRIFSPRSYISLDLVTKMGSRTYLKDGYDPRDFLDSAGRLSVPEGGEAAFLAEVLSNESLPIQAREPLMAELESFVESVTTGTPPAVSGPQGRRAMATAHRIGERIHFHRERVTKKLDE